MRRSTKKQKKRTKSMPTNNNTSYLSREESLAIKAILIFIIALGHNQIFTDSLDDYKVMRYIYTFHIQAFFLLPFLYGSKPLSWERIKNYAIRLYWPYILFASITFILYYCIFQKHGFDVIAYLKTIFIGEVSIIREYTGVQIFWFLPAMFSLTIIKDLYYQSGKTLKCILLILSVISLWLSVMSNSWGEWYRLYSGINKWIPFGAFTGLGYLCLGVALREIISKIQNRDVTVTISIVFLAMTVLFFYNVIALNEFSVFCAIKMTMPVAFMVLIYNLRGNFYSYKHLQNIGSITFPIYIIHPFIGYAMFFIASRYLSINLLWAAVAQLIMFYGAYLLARQLYKRDTIRKKIFPNSIKEFLS